MFFDVFLLILMFLVFGEFQCVFVSFVSVLMFFVWFGGVSFRLVRFLIGFDRFSTFC